MTLNASVESQPGHEAFRALNGYQEAINRVILAVKSCKPLTNDAIIELSTELGNLRDSEFKKTLLLYVKLELRLPVHQQQLTDALPEFFNALVEILEFFTEKYSLPSVKTLTKTPNEDSDKMRCWDTCYVAVEQGDSKIIECVLDLIHAGACSRLWSGRLEIPAFFDFTRTIHALVPMLYVLQASVCMRSTKAFAELVVIEDYKPPAQLVNTLVALATCIPCETGAGGPFDSIFLSDYLEGTFPSKFVDAYSGLSLENSDRKSDSSMCAVRISESLGNSSDRYDMVSARVFASAILFIFFSSRGIAAVLGRRAPTAFSSTIFLCQKPISSLNVQLENAMRANVLDALYLILMEVPSASRGIFVTRWQLSSFISVFKDPLIDETLFESLLWGFLTFFDVNPHNLTMLLKYSCSSKNSYLVQTTALIVFNRLCYEHLLRPVQMCEQQHVELLIHHLKSSVERVVNGEGDILLVTDLSVRAASVCGIFRPSLDVRQELSDCIKPLLSASINPDVLSLPFRLLSDNLLVVASWLLQKDQLRVLLDIREILDCVAEVARVQLENSELRGVERTARILNILDMLKFDVEGYQDIGGVILKNEDLETKKLSIVSSISDRTVEVLSSRIDDIFLDKAHNISKFSAQLQRFPKIFQQFIARISSDFLNKCVRRISGLIERKAFYPRSRQDKLCPSMFRVITFLSNNDLFVDIPVTKARIIILLTAKQLPVNFQVGSNSETDYLLNLNIRSSFTKDSYVNGLINRTVLKGTIKYPIFFRPEVFFQIGRYAKFSGDTSGLVKIMSLVNVQLVPDSTPGEMNNYLGSYDVFGQNYSLFSGLDLRSMASLLFKRLRIQEELDKEAFKEDLFNFLHAIPLAFRLNCFTTTTHMIIRVLKEAIDARKSDAVVDTYIKGLGVFLDISERSFALTYRLLTSPPTISGYLLPRDIMPVLELAENGYVPLQIAESALNIASFFSTSPLQVLSVTELSDDMKALAEMLLRLFGFNVFTEKKVEGIIGNYPTLEWLKYFIDNNQLELIQNDSPEELEQLMDSHFKTDMIHKNFNVYLLLLNKLVLNENGVIIMCKMLEKWVVNYFDQEIENEFEQYERAYNKICEVSVNEIIGKNFNSPKLFYSLGNLLWAQMQQDLINWSDSVLGLSEEGLNTHLKSAPFDTSACGSIETRIAFLKESVKIGCSYLVQYLEMTDESKRCILRDGIIGIHDCCTCIIRSLTPLTVPYNTLQECIDLLADTLMKNEDSDLRSSVIMALNRLLFVFYECLLYSKRTVAKTLYFYLTRRPYTFSYNEQIEENYMAIAYITELLISHYDLAPIFYKSFVITGENDGITLRQLERHLAVLYDEGQIDSSELERVSNKIDSQLRAISELTNIDLPPNYLQMCKKMVGQIILALTTTKALNSMSQISALFGEMLLNNHHLKVSMMTHFPNSVSELINNFCLVNVDSTHHHIIYDERRMEEHGSHTPLDNMVLVFLALVFQSNDEFNEEAEKSSKQISLWIGKHICTALDEIQTSLKEDRNTSIAALKFFTCFSIIYGIFMATINSRREYQIHCHGSLDVLKSLNIFDKLFDTHALFATTRTELVLFEGAIVNMMSDLAMFGGVEVVETRQFSEEEFNEMVDNGYIVDGYESDGLNRRSTDDGHVSNERRHHQVDVDSGSASLINNVGQTDHDTVNVPELREQESENEENPENIFRNSVLGDFEPNSAEEYEDSEMEVDGTASDMETGEVYMSSDEHSDNEEQDGSMGSVYGRNFFSIDLNYEDLVGHEHMSSSGQDSEYEEEDGHDDDDHHHHHHHHHEFHIIEEEVDSSSNEDGTDRESDDDGNDSVMDEDEEEFDGDSSTDNIYGPGNEPAAISRALDRMIGSGVIIGPEALAMLQEYEDDKQAQAMGKDSEEFLDYAFRRYSLPTQYELSGARPTTESYGVELTDDDEWIKKGDPLQLAVNPFKHCSDILPPAVKEILSPRVNDELLPERVVAVKFNRPNSLFSESFMKSIMRSLFVNAFYTEVSSLKNAVLWFCVNKDYHRPFIAELFRSIKMVCSGKIEELYRSLFPKSVPYESSLLPESVTPTLVCSNILVILTSLICEDFQQDVEPYEREMRFVIGQSVVLRISEEITELINVEFPDTLIEILVNPMISNSSRLLASAARIAVEVLTNRKSPTTLPRAHLPSICHILGSKNCGSVSFNKIALLIRKSLSNSAMVEIIIREAIKAKSSIQEWLSEFNQDGKKVLTGKPLVILFTEQVKLLRLFAALQIIHPEPTLLDSLLKMDLMPLWQAIIQNLQELYQRKYATGPVLLLGLLEAITTPANMIINTSEKNGRSDIVDYIKAFIVDELSLGKSIINELIRSKPHVSSGSLGNIALMFGLLDFKNKDIRFKEQLKKMRQVHYRALRIIVNRESLVEDSFYALMKIGHSLKARLLVEFSSESGIDEGGLAREWLECVSREIVNEKLGLFMKTTPESSIYLVNPLSSTVSFTESRTHLDYFRFTGRLIGRAIFDSRTIGNYFSRVIYKYILDIPITIDDMEGVDEDYYKSLQWMLKNPIDDIIFETFSVTVNVLGKKKTVDLVPNGRNISVTDENKHEYIKRIVSYRLIESVEDQMKEIKAGLNDVVPLEHLRIFTDQELELISCGIPDIDIKDWEKHTVYHGFGSQSPQVAWFWIAVKSFNAEERAKLLQFCTGTSRVPPHGFTGLETNSGVGKFNIQKENGSTNRLPSSHTCLNQLVLPAYESYEKLRALLLQAITEGNVGFSFA